MIMLTSRSELLEKIHLGEDHFLELKEVRFAGEKISGPKQQEVADEIAAFANSTGGEIIFGVENKSRLVLGIPLEKLDMLEDMVRQASTDSMNPPLAPIIERITLPDETGVERPVIRVAIARSLFVHHSPAGYLQRIGSAKRPIPPDQLARLFQQRSQARLIRFDETPVPNANLDDLQEELWQRFLPISSLRASLPESDQNILLNKLAMLAQDENKIWRPTVAGLLMACKNPEKYLTGAYIQAVAYSGETTVPQDENAYQLDFQDITGTLDQQIFSACEFVRKNMRIRAHKNNQGGRTDIPQYDMLAVFEAITNAVAHRDYSMAGTKIRIRMLSNRLEIYTPGMLPNTMSPESMVYRQAARNEAITSLLARCPVANNNIAGHRQYIMDKRGEGVPIILERSERLSGKRPVYQMHDSSELQLTIFSKIGTDI